MHESSEDLPLVDTSEVTTSQTEQIAVKSVVSHIGISRETMLAILTERIPHFKVREGLSDEQLYQGYLGAINGEY